MGKETPWHRCIGGGGGKASTGFPSQMGLPEGQWKRRGSEASLNHHRYNGAPSSLPEPFFRTAPIHLMI